MPQQLDDVISLFDGMSCAQIALNRAEIPYKRYFSAEIEKAPIKVALANYPDTIPIGDVRHVHFKDGNLYVGYCWKTGTYRQVHTDVKPGLLCGGSPCQSFSFAGKRKGMSTKDEIEILTLDQYLELKAQEFEFEGQSYLFWEYMRILTEIQQFNPDVEFLLENVMMGSKWQKILTRAIGINPICINSALVCAQNRERLYWTNIAAAPQGFFGDLACQITQPKDLGIYLKHVLEPDVDDKYFLKDNVIEKLIEYELRQKEKGNGFTAKFHTEEEKMSALKIGGGGCDDLIEIITSDSYCVAMRGRPDDEGINNQQFEKNHTGKTNCLTGVTKDNLIVHNMMPRSSKKNRGGTGHLTRTDGKSYCLDTGQTNAIEFTENYMQVNNGGYAQDNRYYFEEGKMGTLDTKSSRAKILMSCKRIIRRLTPIEYERLQTVPDNYTNHTSDRQRYKMLGNGWTVEVIAHIFKSSKYYIN